jgi:putative DNA methylase
VRMIERWFPCTEVSQASGTGWGSGRKERRLFTWFAARPTAQAKAAVLTSLLPWPDDADEQKRLQDLVRLAMRNRNSGQAQVLAELRRLYPNGATVLDPFSGRGLIPLEAARLDQKSIGIDYSPVADIGGHLLADFPFRDWSAEPEIPFDMVPPSDARLVGGRLLEDVTNILTEVDRRLYREMQAFYPGDPASKSLPWAYLWAVTLPCQNCGRRFPMLSSFELRRPTRKGDLGQSLRLDVDREQGSFSTVVHDGSPAGEPTFVSRTKDGRAVPGKVAICPFCDFVHARHIHARLAGEGQGRDSLIAVAELNSLVGKDFRAPHPRDLEAVASAELALQSEPAFSDDLPAIPNELVPPGNNNVITPSLFGAKSYGDFCNARQSLGLVRLSRIIADLGHELTTLWKVSSDYAAALTGYAGAVLVRKLRYSTRGAWLRKSPGGSVAGIFINEASLGFSYDYLEVGLGGGPGTWKSLADDTLGSLKYQFTGAAAKAGSFSRASAISLPVRDASVDAVVTDPPYDMMIPYTDISDLFFVWLRRALITTWPAFGFTTDPYGVQEKFEEIIVKRERPNVGDHRTKAHYDESIALAFREARRAVRSDGIVTIVFGHGDPEVWHRLLSAISKGGLVLTGSWPAKTESGGSQGKANIVTTLTMACRPVLAGRPNGRASTVEDEVRREVKARVPMWESAELAPTDQLMASAGPAMEVVGRYAALFDHRGEQVEPARYLIVARRAVQEAAAIEIDNLPLETFDARTQFALFWVRLYARSLAPKSEGRWQALAADLTASDLKGILTDETKGVRLAFAREAKISVTETSATIDVAFAMACALKQGLDAVSEVLLAAGRDSEDAYLWAALSYLSTKLPEGDPDAIAWTSLVRSRRGIRSVSRDITRGIERAAMAHAARERQGSLFDSVVNPEDDLSVK